MGKWAPIEHSPATCWRPNCRNALAQGQVCRGLLTPSGVSLRRGAQPSWYTLAAFVNAPLSGLAAELFEESGDGFCVSISSQRYL